MKIKIDRSFEKDTSKIKDKEIIGKLLTCIEEAKLVSSLKELKEIKKLKGFKYFYRIRIGEYRVGIEVKNKTIVFIRFLHRKDVYKYFP